MGLPTKSAVIEQFLQENYNEIVTMIRSKYPLDVESKSGFLRIFEDSGLDGEDIAHEAMMAVIKTTSLVTLAKIDEDEREKFLFGCVLKRAEVFVSWHMRLNSRRRKLSAGNVLKEQPSERPRQEAVEFEDAMNQLTPVERAIVRNADIPINELHLRLASSLSNNTFRARLSNKKVRIRAVLDPE